MAYRKAEQKAKANAFQTPNSPHKVDERKIYKHFFECNDFTNIMI